MGVAQLEMEVAENTVRWAHDYLQLNYAQIGQVVGADGRTVRRWASRSNPPSGRHQEHLEKLRELRHLLTVCFSNEEGALRWMHTPVPMLRGRRPISYVLNGELDPVIEALASLEAGVFT